MTPEMLNTSLKIIKKVPAKDNSTKYLLGLADGEVVEAVHIPLDDEIKACISCQVGCTNKCRHCVTGKLDYKRDMTAEEIVAQVVTMAEDKGDNLEIYTILFMGMGEPLFNFESVLNSLDIFESDLKIKPERVTVSTSGVIPPIYALAQLDRRPKLAVSLHATTDSVREKLIPLNKIYGVADLLAATKHYIELTNDEVLIQYTLIDSFNDSDEDAFQLARMVQDLLCEVQVIPFNPFPGASFREPKQERLDFFLNYINSRRISIKLKRSHGIEIYAGCGQLGAEDLL